MKHTQKPLHEGSSFDVAAFVTGGLAGLIASKVMQRAATDLVVTPDLTTLSMEELWLVLTPAERAEIVALAGDELVLPPPPPVGEDQTAYIASLIAQLTAVQAASAASIASLQNQLVIVTDQLTTAQEEIALMELGDSAAAGMLFNPSLVTPTVGQQQGLAFSTHGIALLGATPTGRALYRKTAKGVTSYPVWMPLLDTSEVQTPVEIDLAPGDRVEIVMASALASLVATAHRPQTFPITASPLTQSSPLATSRLGFFEFLESDNLLDLLSTCDLYLLQRQQTAKYARPNGFLAYSVTGTFFVPTLAADKMARIRKNLLCIEDATKLGCGFMVVARTVPVNFTISRASFSDTGAILPMVPGPSPYVPPVE